MGIPYFATGVLGVFGLAYGTQALLRAIEVAVGMGFVFHVLRGTLVARTMGGQDAGKRK